MLEWPQPGERARGLIEGPTGPLEVEVNLPAEAAAGFVVVCHPHPQHGGTLDNKVAFMLARGAVQSGLAAVRFNFRGTGESGGTFDDGAGEADDARAARDWAADTSGLSFAGLAGFSFGSAVALTLAAADGAPSLITVGLPSERFNQGLPRPDSDWLALFGDADDVVDVTTSLADVRALKPEVAVQVMEGAEHFLHGRLGELRKHVVGHFSRLREKE